MHRKDYVIMLLMASIVVALAGMGYYVSHQGLKNTKDCVVIVTHDKETRLNVMPCAQAPMSPVETIKIVPIR